MTPGVYRYSCCQHCEDDDIGGEPRKHMDGHLSRCPDGCNDGDGHEDDAA